jgi:predicted nucleic acid-binding protein
MLLEPRSAHRLRVYLDTSVIGGVFDREFAEDSARLFTAVRDRRATGLVSSVTQEEMAHAPEHVQAVLLDLPEGALVRLPDHGEVQALTEAYLAAGAVTERFRGDAAHIAFATVYNADVLASWNFKHIVNLQRIQQFNAVNLMSGYRTLEIRSPRELFQTDDPDTDDHP